MPDEQVRVSVIIPTYNYSNVLRYAIQSVLWQTEENFECIVVGDHCTDDSEEVVRSFNDNRIRWHNLPENSGNKAIPTNEGIKRARGKYMAFLGHDDLWFPDHLASLLQIAKDSNADLVYSMMATVRPHISQTSVHGLSPQSLYIPEQRINFSSLMCRRDLVDKIGYLRDYRELRKFPLADFFERATEQRKIYRATNDLTVIKIPSDQHNLYVDRPTDLQEIYAHKIAHEPDLRYQLLREFLIQNARSFLTKKVSKHELLDPGETIEGLRQLKGLATPPPSTIETDSSDTASTTLYHNLHQLSNYNKVYDIIPLRSRKAIHQPDNALPDRGLFLGRGWSERVIKRLTGIAARRLFNLADIIVTDPTRKQEFLFLEYKLSSRQADIDAILTIASSATTIVQIPLKASGNLIVRLDLEQVPLTVFTLALDAGRSDENNAQLGYITVTNIDWFSPRHLLRAKDRQHIRSEAFVYGEVAARSILLPIESD